MVNHSEKLTVAYVNKLKPAEKRYTVTDTEVPGFQLRIAPGGAMTYSLLYRSHDGRRVRYTIGKHGAVTPEQARKTANKIHAEVTLGHDPQAGKKKARSETAMPTLGDYIANRYLPWFTAHFRTHSAKTMMASFADLNAVPLDKLTTWHIEKWKTARIKDGMAKTTVNRYMGAFKAAINRAVEWKVIAESPITAAKGYKPDKSGRIRYLSPDEEGRLYAALTARDDQKRQGRANGNEWRASRGYALKANFDPGTFPDYMTPLVKVALNTGMRRGELFNLKWDHVNLPRSVLTVVGVSAKSGQTRHIPLNDTAVAILAQWQAQSGNSGHVFKGKAGGRIDNVNKAWAGITQDAQLDDFHFHDCRHHFASKLVMAGVDLNTVRELLGHSDLKMTLRYAHLCPEHKAAAVAKLVPR